MPSASTRHCAYRSPSAAAAGCGPRRRQVLAHVERAADLIAGDLSGKRQIDGVAVLLAVGASDPDAIAVDRPGDLARHELALVESAKIVPLLRQVQRVRRARGRVLDLHVPLARSDRPSARPASSIPSALAASTARHESIGDDLLVSRRHHVRRDGHSGLIAAAPPRAASSVIRGSPSSSSAGDGLTADADLLPIPQDRQRRRPVRQAVRLHRRVSRLTVETRWLMCSSHPVQRFHSAS